jgi:hypothetical protein
MGVVVVLSLAAIPLGVLFGALRDSTLHRRSRFWLRFAALVVSMVLPWMVALVVAVGEQGLVTLLLVGLAWALLLVALAPLVLFRGPGPSDDSGPGAGPDDDRRPPQAPIGGIPLPYAEPPVSRARGPHRPRRPAYPRRAAPERERRPSRLRPLAR